VPPRLEVTLSAKRVNIGWSTGYILEWLSILPSTSWVPVADPIIVSGDQFSATFSVAESAYFFRLRKNSSAE